MANDKKLRIAIFGGSGYGGSDLLKILLFHPNAEIVFVTANEHAGKPVSAVHRNLNGLTDLQFVTAPADVAGLDLDLAFFALPHGQALSLIPDLPALCDAGRRSSSARRAYRRRLSPR